MPILRQRVKKERKRKRVIKSESKSESERERESERNCSLKNFIFKSLTENELTSQEAISR